MADVAPSSSGSPCRLGQGLQPLEVAPFGDPFHNHPSRLPSKNPFADPLHSYPAKTPSRTHFTVPLKKPVPRNAGGPGAVGATGRGRRNQVLRRPLLRLVHEGYGGGDAASADCSPDVILVENADAETAGPSPTITVYAALNCFAPLCCKKLDQTALDCLGQFLPQDPASH